MHQLEAGKIEKVFDMKDIKLMTREEALEKIESEKEEVGPVGIFYKILENADEGLKSHFENKLIEAIIAGDAMGRALTSAEPGTREHAEIAQHLTRMSQKTRMSVEEELEKATKDVEETSDE